MPHWRIPASLTARKCPVAGRRRWLALVILAFIATLMIGAGVYNGAAPALPVWLQQVMLGAYGMLFAAVPFVYLKKAQPSPDERTMLNLIVGFTTPVALAMESWIGGLRGLQVAGVMAAMLHIGWYQMPVVRAAGLRWVHAILALVSVITAISALNLGDAMSSLLLGAAAALVYTQVPGRMRLLAVVPAVLALLWAGIAQHPLQLSVTAVLLLSAGAYAVRKKYRLDPWFFHGASAVYAGMALAQVMPRGPDGYCAALVVSAALTLALYFCYRKSRDISAFVSHALATAVWLAVTLFWVPHGVVAVGGQVFGAGLFCVIAVIAERLQSGHHVRPLVRLLMVLALPALAGMLMLQHIALEPSWSNTLAFASWMLLAATTLLSVPRLKHWAGSSDMWKRVHSLLALLVMPALIVVQWLAYVGFTEHADGLALQSAWLVIASAVVVRFVPSHLRRAALALAASLLVPWFLKLADMSSAITLAWALGGLGTVVTGSRLSDRNLWLAGAGMCGAVVAKLILLDMSHAEPVWRVLSFICSGLIFLLAGYLAPAPNVSRA
ncbi:DUF2339 domain-containing protein [Paraburkholderia bonniea]|uniref:DUF2339 domain-containing protein n=1 Tax=Paraburkholderia bonniea TaxID=2152891 RepID=UPI002574164C|nr:DUF2339 domain-containing protein [Paraburkholderia bonniea]WJF89932.1 DUF2339 domain-containing protein [Paraburkholderia bonniea]WJF93246.1 DUF2339 domain-containing protein [Paraburkholderia bonniea]